jgi:hypothetical protein
MPRRLLALAGVAALALAALQLLGSAMDLEEGLRHVLVLGHPVLWGVDELLPAFGEAVVGVGWLVAGVALLRGTRGIWGRLVALLVVSIAISTLEAVFKFGGGDIDRSQIASIGLALMIGVVLALPVVRSALIATPAVDAPA